MTPRLSSGLVIGRFLPPHLGHLHLLESARRQVERLTVQVVADAEDVPAPPMSDHGPRGRPRHPTTDVRVAWLRALLPAAVEVVDEPRDRLSSLTARIDVVFGCGTEARNAATALGARLLPIDPERRAIPVRSAQVRENPRACAQVLPELVRRWYGLNDPPHRPEALRVAIVGPECTGKSTLAARLAVALGGTVVPEHAEAIFAAGACDRHALRTSDFEDFARGQIASEDALADLRGGVLLCDSDPLTTRLYAEDLIGECPAWIVRAADTRQYDLTLLSVPNTPWEDAPHRVDPAGREAFFVRIQRELERTGRRTVLLAGDWETRFERALAAIQGI
jgi:HTH-type transcriptional repressor of NAD biosynthesis genes